MEYKFINPEYLDSVSGGDVRIIIEIVDMFRGQVVEVYNEMNSLLNKKDYKSLGLLAHKAKASVAIMGMTDMTNVLKTFELQAKSEEKTELYESYIERFKSETADALKELDDLIKNRLNKNK